MRICPIKTQSAYYQKNTDKLYKIENGKPVKVSFNVITKMDEYLACKTQFSPEDGLGLNNEPSNTGIRYDRLFVINEFGYPGPSETKELTEKQKADIQQMLTSIK